MKPVRSDKLQARTLPDVRHDLPDGLHPVLQRILLSRGVRHAGQLDLSLRAMAAPDRLSGLEQAVQRLVTALREDQRILIVGDFDADGATGTALAVRVLRELGAAHVDYRVPNRFEFGYGLTPGLVDSLEEAPDLLVTVDSGISCLAGVDRAVARGIEVIVTDHHLPGDRLPAAHAIVNPNLEGDAFPSKALAGVGVMFYLLGALRAELRRQGWFDGGRKPPNLASHLGLVALGTVADLVRLDHNNRILVHQGLDRIRAGSAAPGLLALLKFGKRDYRHLVAADLGFAVGPRLNAAGRLEDMAVGIRCLLSDDPDEAHYLAEQLDTLNRDRRNLQDRMIEAAESQVATTLQRLQGELPLGLCLFDPEWHQGIVGLVASRVKDSVHRPVIAFAPESREAPVLKGSARSISGLHIRDVLAHIDARHPGMIGAFGGHAMAAGLSLDRDRLDGFRNAFIESVSHYLGGEAPGETIRTDGELSPTELTLEFAEQLRALGPWGQSFPEPLFDGSFDILEQRVVGSAHLKMKVCPSAGGSALDAIAFRTLPEDLEGRNSVHLLYRLDVNVFRGIRSPQLVIERFVS